MTTLPPNPSRVLAVMAHPDDIEFMCGGLISQWARAGAELHYCLLTDGNSGSRDPNLTPERLAASRREEQRAAGALFDVASYAFLGYPDGRLMADVELRLAVARVIRQVRPDAVITSDPCFYYAPWYINHPDHRAAGEATLAAIMPLANTRLASLELLEEGLEPHDVCDVYLATPDVPTLFVPLTEEDMERKIAAMQRHETQLGGWDAAGLLRNLAGQIAAVARTREVECELAEAYVYIALGRNREQAEARPDAAIA